LIVVNPARWTDQRLLPSVNVTTREVRQVRINKAVRSLVSMTCLENVSNMEPMIWGGERRGRTED